MPGEADSAHLAPAHRRGPSLVFNVTPTWVDGIGACWTMFTLESVANIFAPLGMRPVIRTRLGKPLQ
jgi:hypothetical protein